MISLFKTQWHLSNIPNLRLQKPATAPISTSADQSNVARTIYFMRRVIQKNLSEITLFKTQTHWSHIPQLRLQPLATTPQVLRQLTFVFVACCTRASPSLPEVVLALQVMSALLPASLELACAIASS